MEVQETVCTMPTGKIERISLMHAPSIQAHALVTFLPPSLALSHIHAGMRTCTSSSFTHTCTGAPRHTADISPLLLVPQANMARHKCMTQVIVSRGTHMALGGRAPHFPPQGGSSPQVCALLANVIGPNHKKGAGALAGRLTHDAHHCCNGFILLWAGPSCQPHAEVLPDLRLSKPERGHGKGQLTLEAQSSTRAHQAHQFATAPMMTVLQAEEQKPQGAHDASHCAG